METRIMPDDIKKADEVFLTGTAAEITPVRQIDDVAFTPSKICKMMMEEYDKLVRGEIMSSADDDEINPRITQSGLYRRALHHAGRYGGSANRLKEVLQRYIKKHADNETEANQAYLLIPDIIETLQQEKFIDDEKFVEVRCARRVLAKAIQLMMVRMKLYQQGIELLI